MTPSQFVAAHGSTTTWTTADFESFEHLTLTATRSQRIAARIRLIPRLPRILIARRRLHLAA
jgi:hypothetical protein